ncbi:MAG: amino acid ABC transporter permease [Firmicutes bacterium]|nr:amino acid ABC transporter permease [Bacillota bacterium]
MSFLDHAIRVLPLLLEGLKLSILVTVISAVIGIILGLFIGLGRLSKKFIIKWLATIYVNFIRGTPLLVQLLIIYAGIPQMIMMVTGQPSPMSPILAAIIACSLNSGAYVAEIFRAGIQSIDSGQMEAARSLGLSKNQAMAQVILPQAFRRIIPPLGNELITLLKETSILSAIGLEEMMRKGQLYVASTFQPFPVYIAVALCYFVIVIMISKGLSLLERRLRINVEN